MKSRKVSNLRTTKCCKIIRPMNGVWLRTGPVVDSCDVVTIHRHQRRTVECMDEVCPFCENLWTSEERLFVPVLFGDHVARAVLEIPVSHLERIRGWENQYHSLRALTLECRRSNGLSNGPIEWRVFLRSEGMRSKIIGWHWMEELSETWRQNTIFALQAVGTENSGSKFGPGCDIVGRSDR